MFPTTLVKHLLYWLSDIWQQCWQRRWCVNVFLIHLSETHNISNTFLIRSIPGARLSTTIAQQTSCHSQSDNTAAAKSIQFIDLVSFFYVLFNLFIVLFIHAGAIDYIQRWCYGGNEISSILVRTTTTTLSYFYPIVLKSIFNFLECLGLRTLALACLFVVPMAFWPWEKQCWLILLVMSNIYFRFFF